MPATAVAGHAQRPVAAIGCAKYDQPLWEFSERTYDPPAAQQLVDSAYGVEARRDNKPS